MISGTHSLKLSTTPTKVYQHNKMLQNGEKESMYILVHIKQFKLVSSTAANHDTGRLIIAPQHRSTTAPQEARVAEWHDWQSPVSDRVSDEKCTSLFLTSHLRTRTQEQKGRWKKLPGLLIAVIQVYDLNSFKRGFYDFVFDDLFCLLLEHWFFFFSIVFNQYSFFIKKENLFVN